MLDRTDETAFAAAYRRAREKAATRKDTAARVAADGFEDSNVKLVSALAPKKLDTFPLPASRREVKIRYELLRPSDFVANIAVVASPGLGYQRRPQERMAKLLEIAAHFNPTRLGLFHAWINGDGLPESLDGLGRKFVCLHLLHPAYDEPVLTAIHLDVTNVRDAAVRFAELNPDTTTKVSTKHKFLGRLTAKDMSALEVQAQAELGKLIVGSSGRNGVSPQAAEGLHHMGMLSTVGLLKVNGEWHDKLPNPYFIGLGGYILATGDNSIALRDTLKHHSVQVVEKQMHKVYGASTPHARVTAARFARMLLHLRNYRRQDKVVANWTRVDDVMSEPPFNDRWGALKD